MREEFHTISDGEYSGLLYKLFSKERVEKELNEYLSLDFTPRFGCGIGMSRVIDAMKAAELLPEPIQLLTTVEEKEYLPAKIL